MIVMLRNFYSILGIFVIGCLIVNPAVAQEQVQERVTLEIYAQWKAEMVIMQEISLFAGKDPIAELNKIDNTYSKYYGKDWNKLEEKIENDKKLMDKLNKRVFKILKNRGFNPFISENGEILIPPEFSD